MSLLNKLEEIVKNHEKIEQALSMPEVASNPQELQKLAKKHSDLLPIVEKTIQYRKALKDLEETKEMLRSGDEMVELAKEEMPTIEANVSRLESELKILLVPKDANDDKSVIVEIRGGAGGDEAALFGAVLYRMYMRYAENRSWKVEQLSLHETGIGGLKEVVFLIDGQGAYSRLKFESGVHRVQRVPVTESSGRIHTSTATVAVLPEADEVDVEVRTEDLKIDTFRASGAGGQYVNMTDSAVRITHLPSGVVVSCQDERSQLKNRVKAMQILRAKLYEAKIEAQQNEMAAERKSQVGTGDRSERIRTYNYPQNRITDHRIGLTVHNLDEVLEGYLDEIIDALTTSDQTEKLKASGI